MPKTATPDRGTSSDERRPPDLHRCEIADSLRERGLKVRENVGLSDFRIDLAQPSRRGARGYRANRRAGAQPALRRRLAGSEAATASRPGGCRGTISWLGPQVASSQRCAGPLQRRSRQPLPGQSTRPRVRRQFRLRHPLSASYRLWADREYSTNSTGLSWFHA